MNGETTTDDTGRMTELFEDSINNEDVAGLAVLVAHYRAEAAKWQAAAEEKDRTIDRLWVLVMKSGAFPPPDPDGPKPAGEGR